MMMMMMMKRRRGRRRRRRSSRGQKNSRVAQARGILGLLSVQLGRFHQRFDLGPLPLLPVNVLHVLWIKDVHTRAPCHLLANQATGKLPVALCQDLLQPIDSGCTCSGRQIGSRVIYSGCACSDRRLDLNQGYLFRMYLFGQTVRLDPGLHIPGVPVRTDS